MLSLALALRYVMLIASLGAALGALLKLWEGSAKIFSGFRALAAGDEAATAIGFVLRATDTFLFGLVLVIFAYGIAFGFAIELSAEERERLPRWMRISSLSELKHTLIGVILVYLVVDFATDVAEGNRHPDWHTLLLPSILMIAGAQQLLSMANRERS